MFGYSATGSCTIATTPRMTMRIEITMATIGRLMKNFDMIRLLRRARLSRQADLLAGAHPVAAFDDDPLSRLQPLGHDPERAEARTDLDGADVDGVVGFHDGDLVHALDVLDGALDHEERALLHVDDRPDLGVLAGTQH